MPARTPEYQPTAIEAHWQQWWAEAKTFRAPTGSDRPKYYVLSMFPYPSGTGLHIGHSYNFTISDVMARFHRARGANVLHPFGWDAFGLPAEQAAIQQGLHPRALTERNIARFRKQLQAHGFFVDWEREINTTDPAYFRWSQWIFGQLFRHGLAYVDDRPVWWCPALGTVLANEEVIDGKSERGNFPCERRPLRQWVLRITAYADRLLAGLPALNWPDSTKRLQANWIGRSEGAEVIFGLEGSDATLTVYTTRPDTLFGVTYMVLSPEHPLVAKLTTPEQREAVQAYQQAAAHKSDLDRTELTKDKTGVFTGAFAINPVNQRKVPIWIADYVLMTYGTGAIMAVPAHDERDYEFAQKYRLPIVPVVQPCPHDGNGTGEVPLPFCEEGIATHSDGYTGLPTAEAKARITADLTYGGKGRKAVNYKLRDWLFSRQRYWGEPFPILWVSPDDADRISGALAEAQPKEPVRGFVNGQPMVALGLPASELPLQLPEVTSYQPTGTGESPLAAVPEWRYVWLHTATGATRPHSEACPGPEWIAAERETNTMPQWAGSCWYYLRYCDPANAEHLIGAEAEAYWQTPDFYIGGAEHAVLHCLYARFWHLFLYDIGAVTTPEPFPRLFHQGLLLGEDGEKMSKSRGNTVIPDEIIAKSGADALRTFLMFLGPLDESKPWSNTGIEGINRFLARIWRLALGTEGTVGPKVALAGTDTPAVERALHAAIRKVTDDFERLRTNTAISALMVCLNEFEKAPQITVGTLRQFVQLLAPFAPHFAEEVFSRLGEAAGLSATGSILEAGWPTFDPAKLVETQVKVPVQVNGKVRADLVLAPDCPQDEAVAAALVAAAKFVEGKTVKKVIYVPGKILNLVVG